ncbi:MAG: hypothetical protein ACI974_001325, partial [Paraglaciecola sp.]
ASPTLRRCLRFLPHQQSKFTRSRNTFYLIRVPEGREHHFQQKWLQKLHSRNLPRTSARIATSRTTIGAEMNVPNYKPMLLAP